MKKKALSLILVMVMVLTFTMPVLATGNDSLTVAEMKNFLLERNYPSDYLDTLIDSQIEELYTTAYEGDAYFYSIENVVEDVNENGQIRGNIPASQLSYDVVLSVSTMYYQNATRITKVYVNVTYDWTQLPFFRLTDAIVVNWDSSKFTYESGSFISYDYAKSPSTLNWITTNTWTAPSELTQGGLGVFTNIGYSEIILGNTVSAVGLKGALSFRLIPEPQWSMGYIPGDNSTTINSQYTHNKNLLGSLSFTVQGFTVGINGGLSSDSIAASHTLYYTAL